LAQTKVITLKTQPHAVNACVKRSSQRSFTNENMALISATFYEHESVFAAFLYWSIFWRKNICKKAAHKMAMKLTEGFRIPE